MEDKRITLAEAANLVKNGDTLALGGVTLYRRPVAFVKALLRRDPPLTDLELLCFTAGYESDLLVGAGAVRQVRTCYFGLEIFGFAPQFSESVQRGSLRVIEESETSLALGIRAGLHGVPSIPSRAWQGTEMFRLRPDVQSVSDPYSGATLTAFPAMTCDVAVIHAVIADRAGNARLNNNLGVDRELSALAQTVIVTTEQVVDRLEEPVDLIAPLVAAVVEAPRGAWPTSCYPLYPIGGGEFLRYIDSCNAGKFTEYCDALLNE